MVSAYITKITGDCLCHQY